MIYKDGRPTMSDADAELTNMSLLSYFILQLIDYQHPTPNSRLDVLISLGWKRK